jgi:DNA-binding PadR family transcriptional regulator
MLEFIILGFLLNKSMSGYDIKRCMTTSTANFYDASFGSIYPMLKKMEATGLIKSTETVDGGKYRKAYSITHSGQAAFLQWLEQPIELGRDKHTHLVRIFFYGWLPPGRAKALISAYVDRMAEELAALRQLEQIVSGHAGFFEMSTLVFGKDYYEFNINWCNHLMEKMNRLEQTGELRQRKVET